MMGSFELPPLSDDAAEGRLDALAGGRRLDALAAPLAFFAVPLAFLAVPLAFFAVPPDRARLLLEALARFEALEPLEP
jgi:hypothetical protein